MLQMAGNEDGWEMLQMAGNEDGWEMLQMAGNEANGKCFKQNALNDRQWRW